MSTLRAPTQASEIVVKNDPYVGLACALRNWLLMTELLIVGALVWQTPLAAQMD